MAYFFLKIISVTSTTEADEGQNDISNTTAIPNKLGLNPSVQCYLYLNSTGLRIKWKLCKQFVKFIGNFNYFDLKRPPYYSLRFWCQQEYQSCTYTFWLLKFFPTQAFHCTLILKAHIPTHFINALFYYPNALLDQEGFKGFRAKVLFLRESSKFVPLPATRGQNGFINM